MIRRRVLLGSSIAAGSIYGLGLVAQEPPITESPLFTVHKQIAHVFTLRRGSLGFIGQECLLPEISVLRYADCTPVDSIVAAEDRLLAEACDMHLDAIAQYDDHHKQQHHLAQLLTTRCDPNALPFNIMRAGNRIARVSRRGTANHVLMHPEMFAELQRVNMIQRWMTSVEPVAVGRWTKVALFQHTYILVGEVLPWNQIVAFYRGGDAHVDDPFIRPFNVVDGPMVMISDGNELAMTTYLDKIFRFTLPIPRKTYI